MLYPLPNLAVRLPQWPLIQIVTCGCGAAETPDGAVARFFSTTVGIGSDLSILDLAQLVAKMTNLEGRITTAPRSLTARPAS